MFIMNKQSTKLVNFTEKDYKAAVNGLQSVIDKLSKTVKTMNSQDHDTSKINQAINSFIGLRKQLIKSWDSLSNIEI